MIRVIIANFTILCSLVSVAFYTITERKFLSLSQNRKGPAKVGYLGILQAFADAVKLFTKESVIPANSNLKILKFSSATFFQMCGYLWVFRLSYNHYGFEKFSLLNLVILMGFCIFPLFFAAWSCNSLYTLLGAYRITAQTISYEISLIILILIIGGRGNLLNLKYPNSFPLILILLPLLLVWLFTVTAETHRAPFDFAEGERELVSGFNLEFSGTYFSLLFLAEYLNILFLSTVTSFLFIGYGDLAVIITLIFLRLRTSFPRLRYDFLISVFWVLLLPFSLLSISLLCSL